MDRQKSLDDILLIFQKILSTSDLAGANNSKNEQSILPSYVPPLNAIFSPSEIAAQKEPLSALAQHLSTSILPYFNRASLSPTYYGFVIGGATPAALLGDFLASVYDQNVHVHLPQETISTTLEAATLNLLVELFRLPADWRIGGAGTGGGIFTTGATASNVLGLALGREYVLRAALERKGISTGGDDASLSCGEVGLAELMLEAGVRKIQILSTLPHSSVSKASGIIGLGRRNVISIARGDDDPLNIDLARLEREAQKPDVLNILAVSAGEVNTGRFATDSFDQMTRLRALCDKYGMWMHVDGAFGLFARVLLPGPDEEGNGDDESEEYRDLTGGVAGLELADSITSDCHKLLNVPYDCGVFFTRHKRLSEDVFRNGNAAYLTSNASGSAEGDEIQSPLNIGIENSRRLRALPVYTTLTAYGRAGYRDLLRRQIGLARRVTRWLARDQRFQVLPCNHDEDRGDDAERIRRTFIVVLFRARDDALNGRLVADVNASREIYLSGTVWDGKPAARIAVSNWQVDVQRDGDLIERVLDRAARDL